MEKFKLKYKPFGSIAVLIEWPYKIDIEILNDISLLAVVIQKNLDEFVLETVPSYNSLTVFFDTTKIKYSSILKKIKDVEKNYAPKELKFAKTIWKVPVCYDEEFAYDMDLMVKELELPKEKIVELHCTPVYDVYFIGFLPGFLYLGGLQKQIHFNRKLQPRQRIAKGSVGIAGSQTGIYPRESPGGWNIIGNSPINFFDSDKSPPCFAKAGDKLKFYSVSRKEYNKIKKLNDDNNYLIESEVDEI